MLSQWGIERSCEFNAHVLQPSPPVSLALILARSPTILDNTAWYGMVPDACLLKVFILASQWGAFLTVKTGKVCSGAAALMLSI